MASVGAVSNTESSDNDNETSVNSVQTPPKKKAKRCCLFRREWLLDNDFGWLSQTDDYTANCTICRQSFSVKYEGKSAVTTHAESMKHKNAVKLQKQSKSISSFFVLKNTIEENR